MKITAKQYAEVLFQSVNGQSKDKAKKIVDNFAKVLIENNQSSQLEKILSFFNNIWNQNNMIAEAEITSANELDKDSRKEIDKFIRNNASQKEIETKINIDSGIKGGFIVRLGDQIFDSSLKTRLNEFKKKISD